MLALRILDDDLADRSFDEHDEGDDRDGHGEKDDDQDRRQSTPKLQRAGQSRGHLGDNAGEDDQRNAVADAAS